MMVLISRGISAKLPNKFLFRNKIQNRGLMAQLGLRLGLSHGSAWARLDLLWTVGSGSGGCERRALTGRRRLPEMDEDGGRASRAWWDSSLRCDLGSRRPRRDAGQHGEDDGEVSCSIRSWHDEEAWLESRRQRCSSGRDELVEPRMNQLK